MKKNSPDSANHDSAQRLKALLEAIPDTVIRIDSDYRYLDFKPGEEFTSFVPIEHVLGKRIDEIIPQPLAGRLMKAVDIVLQERQPIRTEFELPKDGKAAYYESRCIPINEQEVLIINRDITSQKLIQRELQQTQKVNSLGVLASNIAHDFNNLLTAILGQASIAAKTLSEEHPAHPRILKIVDAAEMASNLTKQLLMYSGHGLTQLEALNVNTLLVENRQLFRTTVKKNISLIIEANEPVQTIRGDNVQILQVIINLLINASQAIEGNSGEITLKSSVETVTKFDQFWSTGLPLAPGSYVTIVVKDDGQGMDKQTLDLIFEPYFTTKESGNGLGLSITMGIMKGHKGAVLVDSKPNFGTCFKLLFPAIEPPTESAE